MYRVKFQFGCDEFEIAWDRGIVDLRNGFWVNQFFKLDVASNDKFYIMPHMITLVEKI